MEVIEQLRGDLAALAEVERQKTRTLVRRANVAVALLICIGVVFVVLAVQARNAARSNSAVLEKLDDRYDGLVCYASVLADEPPPPNVEC